MMFRILGVVLCLGIFGCTEDKKLPPQTVLISISHGTELRELFGELRSQFYRLAPPLPDGKQVTIDLVSQHPAAVAKSLHSVEERTDAWISPHPFFIQHNNSVQGHRYTHCMSLFETSLGAIGRDTAIRPYLDGEGKVSLQSILESANRGPTVMIPEPIDAATGWTGLEYLASLHLLQSTEPTLSIHTTISNWQKGVSDYNESERALIDFAYRINDRPFMALVTKQQYLRFNQHREIKFYDLNPAASTSTYQLCMSEALANSKQVAFDQFLTFLRTEVAHDIVEKFRFDPHATLRTEKLDENPSNLISQNQAESYFSLLTKWPEIQKPSFRVMVVDASASLEGGAFASIKESLKMAIAESPERSIHSLISFSTESHTHAERTTDRVQLLSKLDKLSPSGGSAVYDGILKGIAQLDTVPSWHARKLMYIVTDGDDKNSHANLLDVLAELSKKTLGEHFRLVIVALRTNPGTSFEDLRQIAKAADGTFIETTPLHAGPVLKELLRSAK